MSPQSLFTAGEWIQGSASNKIRPQGRGRSAGLPAGWMSDVSEGEDRGHREDTHLQALGKAEALTLLELHLCHLRILKHNTYPG